ncbi:MAG TPA: TIGR00730 family Rossman fold protein [Bacteriovoracaceae bacterium]|nr:TIGR00730 family Rossman fold protein [Bacteriovoracaceae bacterium]
MKVCIFCGANASLDPQVDKVVKTLMTHFRANDTELVYGGAGIGIMGALATELMVLGGRVTGVIPQLLMKKEIAHAGLTKLHTVTDMHERKKLMYQLSDAFLILPGGMGTMDELFEILTWKQLGLHSKPIAILNVNRYYDPIIDFFNQATDKGLIKPQDRSLLFASPDWQEVWSYFTENVP